MNVKTTLILFVLVIALGAAIVLLQEKAPPPAPTLAPSRSAAASVEKDSLIPESFGEAISITVEKPDQPSWRFLQSSNGETWEMVEPSPGPVQKWQVAQIGQRLTGAEVSVKFDGLDDTMTPAMAGLEPPRAVVTLENDKNNVIGVEIGRQESERETFVRLVGEVPIYRVKPSLKNLLKDNPLAYRDQQLFKVAAPDIVKIEIAGADTEACTIVKTGGQWRFTDPAPAKAVGQAVSELCSSFAGLRTTAWVEGGVENPSLYGLGDDALTVTVTAEETPAPVDVGTAGETATPEPVIVTHTVRFSSLTPLDDENKVYLRRNDEGLVGTVLKSVADKFKPDFKSWRDNRIIEKDPTLARRVKIDVGDESAEFVRAATTWTYGDDGPTADGVEIEKTLNALKNLRATNFVGGAADDPASFGLDAPQAVLELTFDGAEESTRVVIAGYADPETRRLVYVQTDGADSVAKVRIASAQALIRDPIEFRDRTALSTPADRIEAIEVSRAAGADPTIEPAQEIALEQTDGTWRLTAPVESGVDQGAVDALVAVIANTRATTLLDLDDAAQLADYGLDDPQVTVVYHFLPPETYSVNAEPAGTNGENSEPKITKLQPPAEPRTVHVAQHNGAVFLLRDEQPKIVYEVPASVLDAFKAEYRSRNLFAFEPDQVAEIMVTTSDQTQGFTKTDGAWAFHPEPDIPVDATKITNYLLRIKNLKVVRVIDYAAEDLATYGLDAPAHTVAVTLGETPMPKLLVSGKTTPAGEPYATTEGQPTVFVLPSDAVGQFVIDVAEFETAP